jgi:hypothetical protein
VKVFHVLSNIKRVLEKLKQKSSISRGISYAERCGKWPEFNTVKGIIELALLTTGLRASFWDMSCTLENAFSIID